ncbi:MAG TPA: recombinase RecF [Planctomycetaceae bacterium]|nr:recombinase RecF [Planctomycetaceae bacterium]
MGKSIDKITLKGFKSIEALESFELRKLNVLIGANGAGKSNFVDYFRMLRAMADAAFQKYVLEAGGGDGFFFLGPKVTNEITSRVDFGPNWFKHVLQPSGDGSMMIASETTGYGKTSGTYPASKESYFKSRKDERSYRDRNYPGVGHFIYESVSSWTVYHFHDTSALAPMRREHSLHDWRRFRHDASNMGAFLLHLQEEEPDGYRLIRDTIRLIAPFFDDFLLRPRNRGEDELVRLEWQQKGSDFPFQPNQLSDGTLRFICLATALLQPEPPATIVIDEPELGLHPYAISMLADLIRSAAERTQVIVSTQSPTLLDYFEPEDIVVVTRKQGRSEFERLDAESLSEWLADYSVGELWQKNVVLGGPTSE